VQHENVAARGIFGVRVPLRFFYSFRLNKNNPRDVYTDHRSIVDKFQRFWYNICYQNPLGKYFNIELKSILAQHENLAAKGIFVLEHLCHFSTHFIQTKIAPAIFSKINSSTNYEDFNINIVMITLSESILILNWNR